MKKQVVYVLNTHPGLIHVTLKKKTPNTPESGHTHCFNLMITIKQLILKKSNGDMSSVDKSQDSRRVLVSWPWGYDGTGHSVTYWTKLLSSGAC